MPVELKQLMLSLWKWWWLIALATAMAGALSYWSSSQMPSVYQTTTTLRVGQFLESADPRTADYATSQQLAQGYAQSVRRQPILKAVEVALGLEDSWESLARNVYATAVAGTSLIQISVVDTDPQRAKVVADEIARQLILQSPTSQEEKEYQERQQFVSRQLATLQSKIDQAESQIGDLENRLVTEASARAIQDVQSEIAVRQQQIGAWQDTYAKLLDFFKGSRTNYLSVIEPAYVPIRPIGPNIRLNMLIAAAIGFIIAAGAALLMEYIDDTIKAREDVDRILDLPTLGTMGRITPVRQPLDHLVVKKNPSSPVAEAYRILHTNLQFASVGIHATTLLVTSAGMGEGKTTTACNLAITMAQFGRRVILADADLRRPNVHLLFEAPNQNGLTTLLVDDSLPLEAALQDTAIAGLKILPSGPQPPNAAELLGSEPMEKRVAQMKDVADIIIFDSPPVLPFADACILGAFCKGVILVAHAGKTRTGAIQRAKASLDQVGARIVGVVINRLKTRSDDYHRYYTVVQASSDERSRGDGVSPVGKPSST